jgi:hypothetical protein
MGTVSILLEEFRGRLCSRDADWRREWYASSLEECGFGTVVESIGSTDICMGVIRKISRDCMGAAYSCVNYL